MAKKKKGNNSKQATQTESSTQNLVENQVDVEQTNTNATETTQNEEIGQPSSTNIKVDIVSDVPPVNSDHSILEKSEEKTDDVSSIQEMKNIIKTKDDQIHHQKSFLAEKHHQIEKMKTTISHFEKDLNDLRKENHTIQNESEEKSIDISNLKEKNLILAENLEKLTVQYNKLLDVAEERELNEAQTKITLNKLKKQFESLSEIIVAKERSAFEARVTDIVNKVQELESKVSMLKSPEKQGLYNDQAMISHQDIEYKPNLGKKILSKTSSTPLTPTKRENLVLVKEKTQEEVEEYTKILHLKRSIENILAYFEVLPVGLYKNNFDSSENIGCANIVNYELCEALIATFSSGFNTRIYWFTTTSWYNFLEEVKTVNTEVASYMNKVDIKIAGIMSKYRLESHPKLNEVKFRAFVFEVLNDQKVDKIFGQILDCELRNKFYYDGALIREAQYREKFVKYLSVIAVLPFKLNIEDLLGEKQQGLDLGSSRYYNKK